MTPAEQIARAVLTAFAGPYYVAGTDMQRARVLQAAAELIGPYVALTIAAAVRATDINPT